MHLSDSERTVVLIDGRHLSSISRELGFLVDFRNLQALFSRQTRLVRAIYYSVVADDDGESPIRPLLDWLGYNGYAVVTKPVRTTVDAEGRQHLQGDMRIEMAVDAMEIADGVDHLVLIAGHDSFASLVAALRRRGKRITVLSTMMGARTLVADALRRQADEFVDVADLQASITMAGKEKKSQSEAAEDLEAMETKSTTAEKAAAAEPPRPSTAEAPSSAAVVVERRTRARKTKVPS